MAQISPNELMTALGAENAFWSAAQTYESIVWKEDIEPVFTKEQFDAKYGELIVSNPYPDVP